MNPELEKINQQVSSLNQSTQQFEQQRGVDLPNLSTISSESLSPTTPIKIPTPQEPSAVGRVLATSELTPSPFQDLIQEQETARKQAGAEKITATSQVTDIMKRLGQEPARAAGLAQQNQLPERVQQYNQYTNEINALTAGARNQVQNLYSPNSTLTQAQAAAKAAEINRDASYEITMKEIARSTAGNDITRLQQSIQNQLEIEFAPVRNQLEIQKFLYEDIKDDFTKAEQREFELKLSDRTRALEEKQADKKAVGDLIQTALQNGVDLPPNIAEQMMRDGTRQGALDILAKNRISLADPLGRQLKQAQLASAQLSQRKGLLDLASAGDTNAIKQLGYDPRTIQGDPIAYEDQKFETQENLRRIDQLLSNNVGIKNTTGQLQSPRLSGFSRGLIGGTAAGTAVAPGPGTVVGALGGAVVGIGAAIVEANQTDNFLADASFLFNTTTFDKLVALKKGGATFGALSDSERVAIGRAANEFNAMAISDEAGNIVGFRGTESKLRQNLALIRRGFEAEQESLNIQYGLSNEDLLEISNI